MTNRILRDIRFYESNSHNVEGHYPGELGNYFKPTTDTKYIGQRIARKLNELSFISGTFDHIYINLTTALDKNEILISKRFIDKRIQYVDYGLEPSEFNSLNESERDKFTTELVFKTLKRLYETEISCLQLIDEAKQIIDKFCDKIVIEYKNKKTKDYKVYIGYQIRPERNSDLSRMILHYIDKNTDFNCDVDLYHYGDIYSMVDTIKIIDNQIILLPKKSFEAEIVAKHYDKPFVFDIK
ncbi:MAG: hypothetical protein JZU53_05795 [Paludibacter sp.]|nr:hypothetical protein [Paludibacter sp.]